MEHLIEFLRVSDEYMLEEVKEESEKRLQENLSVENFDIIYECADTYNAENLKEYCKWFKGRTERYNNPNIEESTLFSQDGM